MPHTNPAYLSPDDPTAKMLKGIAELGVGISFCGMVMTAFPREKNPIPMAVLRYVFGPLIVHVNGGDDGDLGWHSRDSLRTWKPRVEIERLEILCGERPDIVSPAEIWLCMYNATMTSPLVHNLTEIYLWASARACVAAGKEHPLMRNANLYPLATDHDVLDDDGRYHHDYRELCREIIRKVIAHNSLGRPRRGRRIMDPDGDPDGQKVPGT
jgi:hypothetical protein